MRKALVVVAGLVVVVGGLAYAWNRSQQGACAKFLCFSGVVVEVPPTVFAVDVQTVHIELCLRSGRCVEGAVEKSSAEPDTVAGPSGAVSVRFSFEAKDGRIDPKGAVVIIRDRTTGEQRYRGVFADDVTAKKWRPNGPDCEPVCWIVSASARPDGTVVPHGA